MTTTSNASTTAGELSGHTALVTGATSGIGRAAAVKLAEHGASVLVHGRDDALAVAGSSCSSDTARTVRRCMSLLGFLSC
jgi:NAD(P)-dependent dehydrogenase (short-subunit alcohol dehydrogenase family)